MKLVDKIVAAARKAATGSDWTEVSFSLSGITTREVIQENFTLIHGCLPFGWSIKQFRGADTITITRKCNG